MNARNWNHYKLKSFLFLSVPSSYRSSELQRLKSRKILSRAAVIERNEEDKSRNLRISRNNDQHLIIIRYCSKQNQIKSISTRQKHF